VKQWKKEFGGNLISTYDWISTLCVVLAFLALVLNNGHVLLVVGVGFAYVFLSKMYDKYVGHGITLINKRKTYRLFPGDEVDVDLRLQNNSRLPVINGNIQFYAGNVISNERFYSVSHKKVNLYEVPLSIIDKGDAYVTLNMKAEKRGVSRMKGIEYHFPHLISFINITLFFREFYRTEFIVYPTPIPVKGLEEQFHVTIGAQRTTFSPFEDQLSPMGTRDYLPSDPFHRINWKASARMQSLQTKVYERVHDITWVFVVNITESTRLRNAYISHNLENILSYVTYMCQFAADKGYAYEIHINARKAGSPPYFYLHEGEGKEHLRWALEFLARVSTDEFPLPYENMLYKVDQDLYKPKTLFLFGEVSPEAELYARSWEKKRMNVYHIKEYEDGAYIGNVVKEVAAQ